MKWMITPTVKTISHPHGAVITLTRVVALAFSAFGLGAKPPPATPMPSVVVRDKAGEYGPEKWAWEGTAVVADPLNHETLYLGGRCGGAEFGTLGDWALADDGKTWRAMRFSNALLDPLREKILAARRLARDGEAAGRNRFYAEPPSGAQTKDVDDDQSRSIGQSLKTSRQAFDALGDVATTAVEAEAVNHAKLLLQKAIEYLDRAASALAGGKLDAAILKACFDAQWALDEAADCLAVSPGPRVGAFAAYDSDRHCVYLFGGSHGDYVTGDMWTYDCQARSWRQHWPSVAPSPRAFRAEPTLAEKGSPPPATVRYDADRKRFIISGGVTILGKMVYQMGFAPLPADEWAFDPSTHEWSSTSTGPSPAQTAVRRTYRTIVPAYDPRWFDSAPRADDEKTARQLKELVPNRWTNVAVPERGAAEREWGTARYDPDRDQIYRWTGGHQADPSNAMTTYHPGVNRYSIGYIPEIYGKGMSFNGRPDCLNHTYLHCDYDPISRCMVCTSMGGTGIYNPDRCDWDYSIAQPFNHHIYETCTVSTPQGAIVWTPGFFGVMDVKAREWKKLPVVGKLPRSVTDGSALTYDRKRDCVWIFSHRDYQRPEGQVWQYDMKSGVVKQMDPAGRASFDAPKGLKEIRESVYVPTADLVLLNNFIGDTEVAYDPVANRWLLLHVARSQERLGTVSDTLIYDTKRDLVWNLNAYKLVYVLKLDRASLQIEDAR